MLHLIQAIISSLILLFSPKNQPLITPINQKIISIPPTVLVIHPTVTPTITKIIKKISILPKPTPDSTPWGVSKQISEHGWTMKIAPDPSMANPKDTYNSLNHYRAIHGSSALNWDETLATYAQTRADYLFSLKNVDDHHGLIDYLDNQDGYQKLGFNSIGENISYGYQLIGVHLIEWLFAGDQPHNDNQLNKQWTHVGIGIKGTAVSLIFAADKR